MSSIDGTDTTGMHSKGLDGMSGPCFKLNKVHTNWSKIVCSLSEDPWYSSDNHKQHIKNRGGKTFLLKFIL